MSTSTETQNGGRFLPAKDIVPDAYAVSERPIGDFVTLLPALRIGNRIEYLPTKTNPRGRTQRARDGQLFVPRDALPVDPINALAVRISIDSPALRSVVTWTDLPDRAIHPPIRGQPPQGGSESNPGDAEITKIARSLVDSKGQSVIDRWLPRLADESSDVREQAAEKLAGLAAGSDEFRSIVLPRLFDIARSESNWVIVSNSILYETESIPKTDSSWLDAFVDLYIDCTDKPDDFSGVIEENAYRLLRELMEEAYLTPQHPRFDSVIEMARRDMERKKGDVRKELYGILDWYEDNIA